MEQLRMQDVKVIICDRCTEANLRASALGCDLHNALCQLSDLQQRYFQRGDTINELHEGLRALTRENERLRRLMPLRIKEEQDEQQYNFMIKEDPCYDHSIQFNFNPDPFLK